MSKACGCDDCTLFRKWSKKCKELILRYFKESDFIWLCNENSRGSIDDDVARFLLANGAEECLEEDVSFGYQVGGVSERVLIGMSDKGVVYETKSGKKFVLKQGYGVHSVRHFEAWEV